MVFMRVVNTFKKCYFQVLGWCGKCINFKEEAYERLIEMRRNDDYKTGNLLDYEYLKHKNITNQLQ